MDEEYWEEKLWIEQHTPITNHFNNDACYDGYAFETFGEEFEYVKKVYKSNPEKVWTYVEEDDGFFIAHGIVYVNRLFYLIT